MSPQDATIGRLYDVTARDCCIEIGFKARLLLVEDDGDHTEWDNGLSIEAMRDIVELTEVP